jgi:hypothetical protein
MTIPTFTISRAVTWCLKNKRSTPPTTTISASTYSTTDARIPIGPSYSNWPFRQYPNGNGDISLRQERRGLGGQRSIVVDVSIRLNREGRTRYHWMD